MFKSSRNKFLGLLRSCVNNNCKHAFRLRRMLLAFLKNTPLVNHVKTIDISRLYIHDSEVRLEQDEFCLVVSLSDPDFITETPHHFLSMRVFYQVN